MIGQLLSGRYKVQRILGAGGFGQTFVAEDTQRPGNPVCVVKQLKPASSDPNFLETARRMFRSEGEVLERLGNHPQIPRLLANFEQEQEFYLVQEYIDGQTLSAELQVGKKWTENQVVDLLKQTLSVLAFVHQNGVIHRDVKPDNIIRRKSDNKLVLVDFGAVKQVRNQTAMGQKMLSATIAIGTPGYMPSEQGIGKPKPSSDIYALGVIAIQALTGLSPSPQQEDTDTGFRYDHNTGELVWQDKAQVNPNLAAILTKMVKHNFPERYASAVEALQALEQLQSGYTPTVQVSHQSYTPTVQVTYPSNSSSQFSTAPAKNSNTTRTQQVTSHQNRPERGLSNNLMIAGATLLSLLTAGGISHLNSTRPQPQPSPTVVVTASSPTASPPIPPAKSPPPVSASPTINPTTSPPPVSVSPTINPTTSPPSVSVSPTINPTTSPPPPNNAELERLAELERQRQADMTAMNNLLLAAQEHRSFINNNPNMSAEDKLVMDRLTSEFYRACADLKNTGKIKDANLCINELNSILGTSGL